MLLKKCSLLVLALSFSIFIQAEIITEDIHYKVDGVEYTGYMAYDNSTGAHPGVLLVHEWWGLNDYAKTRAYMLAKQGYTAFALDMYGSGKQAAHPDNAKTFMMEVFNNMPSAEKRFDAAYAILNQHKFTKKNQIAALGYCFGGAIVLHMARTGKSLAGVVSFHGSLGSNIAADKKPTIHSKIRVFTGGADVMIPAAQVTAFTEEMLAAKADFAVQVYPAAKHSFTNPNADRVGEKFAMPLAYNKEADADSWQATLAFLKSLFKS